MGWRRVARIAGAVVAVGAVLLVVAVLALGTWLGSPAGNRWIRELLVEQVRAAQVQGAFRLGDLETDAWSRLVVDGVALTDVDGSPVLAAERVEVGFRLLPLLRGRVVLPYVELDDAVVDLVLEDNGVLNVERLFGVTDPGPDEDWTGLPVDLVIARGAVDGGSFRYRTPDDDWHLTGITALVGVHAIGRRLMVSGADVRADLRAPGALPLEATGGFVYEGDRIELLSTTVRAPGTELVAVGEVSGLESDGGAIALDLGLRPLQVASIEAFFSEPLPVAGVWTGNVGLTGPFSAMRVVADLRGPPQAGALVADAVLDVEDPELPWSGTARVRGFDFAYLFEDLDEEVVATAAFTASGRGTELPESMTIEGALAAERLDVAGFDVYGAEVPLRLEGGVLTLGASRVRSELGTHAVQGTVDVVGGDLDLLVNGDLAPGALDRFDVDLAGDVDARVRIVGNVLADGVPLDLEGDAVVDDLSWLGDDVRARHLEAGFVGAVRDGAVTVQADTLTATDGELFGLGFDVLGAAGLVVDVGADGSVRFDDRFEALGVTYGPDMQFAEAAGTLTGEVTDGATAVRVDVAAADAVVYGVEMARAVSPDLAVTVSPEGAVALRATLRAERLAYPDLVITDQATGPLVVDVTPDGEAVTTIDADLGPFVALDRITGTAGGVALRVDDTAATFDVTLFDDDRTVLDTTGAYALESGEIVLDTLRAEPREGEVLVGVGTQRFTLVEGGIADADLRIEGDLGELALTGTVGTVGEIDAEVDARDVDLAFVDWLFGLDQGLSGRAGATGRLGGQAGALDFALDVRADDVLATGLERPISAVGRIAGRDGEILADVAASVDGSPLVEVRGRLPAVLDLDALGFDPDGQVDAEIVVPPGGLERLGLFVPEEDLPDGALSALLEIEGPVRDPIFHLFAVVEASVPDLPEVTRFEVDVRRDADALVAWGRGYEGMVHRATLDGGADVDVPGLIAAALGEEPLDEGEWADLVADMDLKLFLKGVPAGRIVDLTGVRADIEGVVDGGIAIVGSPVRPEITAGLAVSELTVGDGSLGGGFVGFVPEGDGYRLDTVFEFDEEGGLVVGGTVPLAVDLRAPASTWLGEGGLAIDVSGEGVPLAVLAAFDPEITDVEGHVAIEGAIRGAASDPEFELTASLDGGTFTYPALGLRLFELGFEVVATERNVRLTRPLAFRTEALQTALAGGPSLPDLDLSLRRGDGSRVQVTGAMTLDRWSPGRVQAAVRLMDTVISGRERQYVRVTGTAGQGGLAATVGGVWPALEIEGAIGVNEAIVLRDVASFLETGALEVDPELLVVRDGVDAAEDAPEPEEAPPFYEDFDVRVAVDLRENVQAGASMIYGDDLGEFGGALFQLDLLARLGGEVTLLVRDGEFGLSGVVDVLGGDARTLGAVLELERGSVSFTERDWLDPRLDLTAVRNVGGAEVELTIRGTVEEPLVDFRSNDYPDRQQVFAMLITGRRPEEVGVDAGAMLAQQLVAAGLFGGLLGGGRFGYVTVDPDGTLRVRVPAAELLGVIGDVRGVYAEWVVRPQARLDENRTVVELEWDVTRGVVLEAAYGNRRSWFNAFWETRF